MRRAGKKKREYEASLYRFPYTIEPTKHCFQENCYAV
jgi:hypothetical protein